MTEPIDFGVNFSDNATDPANIPVEINYPMLRDRAMQFAATIPHEVILDLLKDTDLTVSYLLNGTLPEDALGPL
jgi:hypothetical protein